MLKNNINIEDAELLFNKIQAHNKKSSPDKQLYKYILENGTTKFSAPYYISWEITAACNLRCKHCCFAGQEYNPKNDLSFEQASQLIKEFINLDVIKVMITGGEPFLRPDIIEIISALKKHNIIIEVTSNALLITESVVQKLKKILNPLCDYIQVSLDGATQKTHEYTRGSGTYLKTIDNIKMLIDNGINITVNCVVTSQNVREMSELYNLASNLGVKNITFTRIFTEYNNKLRPDSNILFDETIKLLKIENPKTKIDLRLFTIPELAACKVFESFAPQIPNESITGMCHKWEKLHIRQDGEVFLCLHSSNQNLFSLGNVKNSSFESILESRKDNILFGQRKVKSDKCNACLFKSMCKSGCPINAYLKSSDINVPDPSCIKC